MESGLKRLQVDSRVAMVMAVEYWSLTCISSASTGTRSLAPTVLQIPFSFSIHFIASINLLSLLLLFCYFVFELISFAFSDSVSVFYGFAVNRSGNILFKFSHSFHAY